MRSLPNYRSLLTFCAVTTLLFPFGTATPAGAEAQTLDATPTAEIVTDLETLAQQALTLEEVQDEGSHYQVSTEEAQIEIPKNSVEPITLSQNDGEDVSISLPFSSVGNQAEEGEYGEISYDHVGLDASSSVLPRDDGSVQMVTTIESSSAPQEYAYQLDLPEGTSLELLEDGGFLALNPDGSLALGGAAPWAKDANGEDVPTHYEIRGSSLVQVVEHQNRNNVSYPVTADPWLGRDLISSVRITNNNQGRWYSVDVVPTGWSRTFSGSRTFDAHVQELIDKTNHWLISPTIREQYLCHVAGNMFVWDEYNMESYRPYKPWHQQLNWNDRCNP